MRNLSWIAISLFVSFALADEVKQQPVRTAHKEDPLTVQKELKKIERKLDQSQLEAKIRGQVPKKETKISQ